MAREASDNGVVGPNGDVGGELSLEFGFSGISGDSVNVEVLKGLLKSCYRRISNPGSDLEQLTALAAGWVYLG